MSSTWIRVIGRAGVIGVTVLLWDGRAAAQDYPGNPTPNQLVAYCEAEWNLFTDNGDMDVTGSRVLFAALKSSTQDLRSGVWFTEHMQRKTVEASKTFADCLSRGVLAGRNHTFRTPSMTVRTPIDNNPMGRQDPAKRPHQE